jgi:Ribonuclease D
MERISNEKIRELPLYRGLQPRNIKIVETEHDAAQALIVLNNEICIGFDTESKPIFQKGVTSPGPVLIQLATESKAFLFPTRFSAAISAAKKILSNENIKKVGFGIDGDIKELYTKFNIMVLNTENLSLAKPLIGEGKPIGARAAVAMVLNYRLGKGAQKSNWGAYPLETRQIQYAANDAHSAIRVAKALDL